MRYLDEQRAAQIKNFIMKLSDNTQIFDPLNREILGFGKTEEQNDLAIKIEELNEKLAEMDYIEATTLNAPLTPDAFSRINCLFDENYK